MKRRIFICWGILIAFSIPAFAGIWMSKSVIGTGGKTQTGERNMISGTLGQPVIGIVSGSLNSQEIGFWYVPGYYTSLEEDEEGPILSFRFGQNHPNPFNPVTTLEFTLPEEGRVKLTLFDVRGRLLRIIVDEEIAAGRHTLELRAEGLASGIYFCRIDAGQFSKTRKMVLMK